MLSKSLRRIQNAWNLELATNSAEPTKKFLNRPVNCTIDRTKPFHVNRRVNHTHRCTTCALACVDYCALRETRETRVDCAKLAIVWTVLCAAHMGHAPWFVCLGRAPACHKPGLRFDFLVLGLYILNRIKMFSQQSVPQLDIWPPS